MNVIELINVEKAFRRKEIYKEVNLTVKEGECVGFIGENGVGKSVLFKIISGIEPVTQGAVLIRGEQLGIKMDFPRDMGILINSPGYIEYYTGFKNLQMLAEIQNKISKEDIKTTMKLVGLNPNDKTVVKNYSVGMKQKLGIAQAIMENQDIIILDEPFNALDFKTNREIINLLRKLKEERKTILLTSHQHEYLERLCDKLYYISNKTIVLLDDEIRSKYFEVS